MKKSKAASTARMSRTTKQQLAQQPPPSLIMSNNENDISFGNNVGSATNTAPSDNDYHNHHYSQKQQHLLVNNGSNNMNPPQNPLPSLQYSNGAMYQQQQLQQGGQLGIGQQLQNGQLSNGQQQSSQLGNGQLLQNGQQSQYVQINQGGQVHTMTRQQQQQRQQYPQQRQDHLTNKRQDSGNNGQLDADKVALSQKNHRLAKELSDLRVKHREETKTVSRLTMENMNLASRCRQAISEAADLKRKLSGYEKRHGDFGILQKEVLLLRRQIEKQHGGNGSGVEKGGSSRRNRSTSPKKEKRNSGSDGGVSNSPVDEKKKKKALASASVVVSGSVTTDLDRIMAQELFKKNDGAAAATAATAAVANVGNGSGGGASDVTSGNAAEKKEGSAIAVTKKFQELNISTTTTTATTTTNNKSVGGSKVTSLSASSSNVTTSSSSKRSITPATTTSSTTESANNNNSSNISSANTKIPISVTTSSATQKDDEFDAEIDMVDFFATSSKPTLGTSSSSVTGAANSSSISSGTDTLPPTSQHTRSHITHKLKKTETDDHMPEELVGTAELLSPSASSKKNVGDNLLSSLDAFEASFASAFPETSFSIKSEAPSSTQLDMSFDVPVFDPFFKSPANKDRDGSLASSSLQSSPKPKTSSSLLSSSGVTGSGSNHHKDGMKSQLKDLFPDSALTTSPKRGLDLTFDSTFADVDIGGGSSSNSKSGKGKSSLSADKLDSAFSRAHASTPPKASGGGVKLSSSIRPTSLDMSAEIEQLDALASATEKADGGDRKRSVRKVKTPLSYAEPSTKQKLRRGDVLFPKIDADRKMELEAKRSKSGGSAATDLDRIMSEHFSVGNNKKDNKKDGTAPS